MGWAGAVAAVSGSSGNATYTYNPLDNLTNVTQGTQSRTFQYDSLSRLEKATNPESGLVSYVYDDKGNLKRRTDGRSVVTTWGNYDALNRPTSKSYSDPRHPSHPA